MDIAKTNVSDRRTGEPTSAEKMHALPWALSAQTNFARIAKFKAFSIAKQSGYSFGPS